MGLRVIMRTTKHSSRVIVPSELADCSLAGNNLCSSENESTQS